MELESRNCGKHQNKTQQVRYKTFICERQLEKNVLTQETLMKRKNKNIFSAPNINVRLTKIYNFLYQSFSVSSFTNFRDK